MPTFRDRQGRFTTESIFRGLFGGSEPAPEARPTYRDTRGRFTTESIFRSLFSSPEPEPSAPSGPAGASTWNEVQRPLGFVWTTQEWDDVDKQWVGDIEPLDIDEMNRQMMPGSEYRLIYTVPDNPDYPRGIGTTRPFYNEPITREMIEEKGGTSIIGVYFYTGSY